MTSSRSRRSNARVPRSAPGIARRQADARRSRASRARGVAVDAAATDARRQGRVLRVPHTKPGAALDEHLARLRAGGGQEAADPEGDALGRSGAPVRAPGARLVMLHGAASCRARCSAWPAATRPAAIASWARRDRADRSPRARLRPDPEPIEGSGRSPRFAAACGRSSRDGAAQMPRTRVRSSATTGSARRSDRAGRAPGVYAAFDAASSPCRRNA